jgi:hypothetical protein
VTEFIIHRYYLSVLNTCVVAITDVSESVVESSRDFLLTIIDSHI